MSDVKNLITVQDYLCIWVRKCLFNTTSMTISFFVYVLWWFEDFWDCVRRLWRFFFFLDFFAEFERAVRKENRIRFIFLRCFWNNCHRFEQNYVFTLLFSGSEYAISCDFHIKKKERKEETVTRESLYSHARVHLPWNMGFVKSTRWKWCHIFLSFFHSQTYFIVRKEWYSYVT